MTKTCFKCQTEKPLTDFYRHAAMGDGHLNKCKDCTKSDVRAHRRDNEHVREYDRKRSKLSHRVELRKSVFRRYKEEHPDRMKALSALNNAVRDGRVKKQPCHFCEGTDGIEAHHHDYSKPLDVTWLCRLHHRRLHALESLGRLTFPYKETSPTDRA